MKRTRLFPILLFAFWTMLSSGCKPDMDLTEGKGEWLEMTAFRRLFTNGTQTDSTNQTGGFGTYRFRNNGRGSYLSATDEADFDWYWTEHDSLLKICFNTGGLLQCDEIKAWFPAPDEQIWVKTNTIDAVTYETVTTGLTRTN